jgi:predicted RNA-binding protein Jag
MLFNGKTIEEALITAEKETGKKREEFVYKVIEKKSGLFKSKEYEIEITGYKKTGMLEIKNGRVIFHSGDIKPSLTPGENVVVRVNGKVVTSKTWIKEEDEIEVEVLNTESGRSAFIEISEDKLTAHIEIKYLSERAFEIVDKEPSQDIVVEAECIRSIIPELYSRKDIEELLSSNNIKYGVQWQNITQIINGGRHVIAEGLAPIAPENDKLNYFFNNGNEKKPIEINGKVDYYSIGKIDTVESGAI